MSVSVIVPAYNEERYIGDAIESVIAQTFPDWELIIVDDGSTDRTGEIAKDFCSRDSCIRLVTRENGGLAKARNTGIAAASGAFLAFLDADDKWHPTKLEKQLELITTTKAGVIFSDVDHFANEAIALPTHLFGIYSGFYSGREMFVQLYQRNAIPISSVLLVRQLTGSECFFDESSNLRGVEDYELWLRLASKGVGFFGMEEKLIAYRSHRTQMSRRLVSMISSTLNLRKKYQDVARELGIDVAEYRRRDFRDLVRESARNGQYKIAWGGIGKLWDTHLCGKRGRLSALRGLLRLVAAILLRPLAGAGSKKRAA